MIVPEQVAENSRLSQTGSAWLDRLPELVRELQGRWSLTLGAPFDGPEVSAAWVAPVRRADGTAAVLKLGMPHMEADHEIAGLQFWNGDPTIRLLEADEDANAMLLETCEPGTSLRELHEEEQDVIVSTLLRRLWRVPPDPHPFRPLSAMLAAWSEETNADQERWTDPGLVREGLRAFEELSRTPGNAEDVLLATDLHAGNVLRAMREPWLVIDPKPFVGDPAYDATQHLLNCQARLREDALGTIERFAELLEIDRERVRLWTLARAAAEPRDAWDEGSMALAHTLAP